MEKRIEAFRTSTAREARISELQKWADFKAFFKRSEEIGSDGSTLYSVEYDEDQMNWYR